MKIAVTFLKPDGTTAHSSTITGSSGTYTISDIPSGNNYIIRIVGQSGASPVWEAEVYGYLKTLVGGGVAVATINKSTTPAGKVMHDLASGDSAGKAQAASIDPDALKTEIASDLSGKIPDSAAIANAIRSAATGTIPSILTPYYQSNFEVAAAPGDQPESEYTIAYSATNQEYMVVWNDKRRVSTGDLYVRRLSSTGTFIGDEILLSSSSTLSYRCKIAAEANGEYLVVGRTGTANPDIYAFRISSTGAKIGGTITVSTGAGAQLEPHVTYNPASSEYLVVWTDFRAGLSGLANGATATFGEVYGRRVSSIGDVLGTDTLISTVIGGNNLRPEVTANNAGDYLVAWQTYNTSGSTLTTIYAQQLHSDLSFVGVNLNVSGNTNAANDHTGGIAAAPDGTFFVVWDHFPDRAGAQGILNGVLTGSRIDFATPTHQQSNPRITYNSSSQEFLVVWRDNRNTATTGEDIYGQRMSSTGTVLGGNIVISTASSHQRWSRPAASGANGYLVIWGDYRNDATNGTDVYGQLISTSGALLPANGS